MTFFKGIKVPTLKQVKTCYSNAAYANIFVNAAENAFSGHEILSSQFFLSRRQKCGNYDDFE